MRLCSARPAVFRRVGVLAVLLFGLASCGPPGEPVDLGETRIETNQAKPNVFQQLFTGGGGGGGGNATGIRVNTYLWRASLDTVSFMPLVSADPFGGVIITDWYNSPESPYERFKMVVYILDDKLRADGVRVNIFRQQLVDGTAWKDAAVSEDTGTQLENAILTRARQMRIKALKAR